MKFKGKSYDEIKKNVQDYLENPPMIALPGGSWCHFCNRELCMNQRHRNPQMLLIVINKLMLELEESRKIKFCQCGDTTINQNGICDTCLIFTQSKIEKNHSLKEW